MAADGAERDANDSVLLSCSKSQQPSSNSQGHFYDPRGKARLRDRRVDEDSCPPGGSAPALASRYRWRSWSRP